LKELNVSVLSLFEKGVILKARLAEFDGDIVVAMVSFNAGAESHDIFQPNPADKSLFA